MYILLFRKQLNPKDDVGNKNFSLACHTLGLIFLNSEINQITPVPDLCYMKLLFVVPRL